MSFLLNSVSNYTPIVHFDEEINNDNLYSPVPNNRQSDVEKYNEVQKKMRDEIITYNFQRFVNGQLALSIMSLILLNYEILKD